MRRVVILFLAVACEKAVSPVDRSLEVPLARSRAGAELRWTDPSITLVPILPDASSQISRSDFTRAIDEAASAWSSALEGCSNLYIHIAPVIESPGRIQQDGRSVIMVRSRRWCPDETTADERCHDRSRQAITHLYPLSGHGYGHADVREADIEINGVFFRWSLDGDAPNTRSLRAILVHEMGHLLGLDHSCSPTGRRNVGPIDEPIPRCDDAGAAASIMYPSPTEPGRHPVLEPRKGDVAALCRLYPAGPR